jgi:hypothetical protein
MTEPKLLTEVGVRALLDLSTKPDAFRAYLDELGLIAPEPVDEITVELCNAMNASVDRLGHFTQDEAENLREELCSRGIEIGRAERPALTQEMVEAGLVIVPVEPTEAMVKAGVDLASRIRLSPEYSWKDYMRNLHRAMIAAAKGEAGD